MLFNSIEFTIFLPIVFFALLVCVQSKSAVAECVCALCIVCFLWLVELAIFDFDCVHVFV